MKQGIVIGFAGIALLGGILLFARQKPDAPVAEVKTERTTREVALACDPEMGHAFHVHPTLQIVVNGETVPLPPNIGIRQGCMTVLHTHEPDGTIHVESPEKRDFTLADFFAVWEQPFSKDEVLTFKIDATHHITITIDGQEVDSYENTILRDGEKIVITYGE